MGLTGLARTLVLVSMVGVMVQGNIILTHIKTEYMPYEYSPDLYGFDTAAVEKGALDKNDNFVYAVGKNLIHVISFKDLSAISNVYHVVLPDDVGATDVSACGTWVAVSASNNVDATQGRVYIYSAYTAGGSMTLQNTISVGTIPDMLKFTRDCMKIVVAIEGSLTADTSGDPFDAEGEVVTIEFMTDPSGIYGVTRADFTSFNSMADEYVGRGVRWVYKGENAPFSTTFSQDMEPEYIALNEDETVAYVVLQENNAVATLDMTTGQFTEIYSLGQKSWLSSAFDPSDQDNDALIRPWDVYGAYQPDGFKFALYNDQPFLVTANEGDQKEYDIGGLVWSETQRGEDFYDNNQIADSVPQSLQDSLNDDEQLGRLDLSLVDYKDADDKYYKFLSYGARSFSIFKVDNLGNISIHWDSGSEFEQRILNTYGHVFNANPDANEVDTESRDTRSDKSGPEPESIELGDLNGTPLIFVGIERPGFIAVYSVNPVTATPQFESLKYSCDTGETWGDMYDAQTCWDLDPEGLTFIPADRSPSGIPMLTVFSVVSSTVSFYSITQAADDLSANDTPQNPDDVTSTLSPGAIAGIVCLCVVVVAAAVLVTQHITKNKRRSQSDATVSTLNLPPNEVKDVV